ncbi:hypothetical protein, partial [Serratia sp. ME43]|uniref:hypothetical protein n=1 Tax=Serratia sp. ME43 TaxID=2744256 RepID=UPI001C711087
RSSCVAKTFEDPIPEYPFPERNPTAWCPDSRTPFFSAPAGKYETIAQPIKNKKLTMSLFYSRRVVSFTLRGCNARRLGPA